MLRRIRLIVDLAGNRENAFYRSMVPLAQPAILKEIIRGLACDPDNRDLLMQIANNEKVCKQLHLPFQAGSTKVLKDMNRK